MSMVIELFKSDEGVLSRDGKRDSSTRLYLAMGYSTRTAALAAVAVVAPAVNPTDNLAKQAYSAEQIAVQDWIIRVEYGAIEPLDVGEFTFSWDSTGATAHLSVPRSCEVYPVDGYTAPTDLKKAIAVDRDRRVQGVDVPAPSLKITLSYRMPKATVTLAYVRQLSRCVGKTNLYEYAGFEPYEMLFLGSTGRAGTATDPTIDFNFLIGENLVGQTFGDIAGVDKHAHDLIWPWFGDAKDETADELITKPLALYVDEVCEAIDYASLETDNVPQGDATTTGAPGP